MTKQEKLLLKMHNNPNGWRIEDLQTLAKKYGIEWRHNGTSHVCFKFPSGVFPIPAKRPIKAFYIIELLKKIEEEI